MAYKTDELHEIQEKIKDIQSTLDDIEKLADDLDTKVIELSEENEDLKFQVDRLGDELKTAQTRASV